MHLGLLSNRSCWLSRKKQVQVTQTLYFEELHACCCRLASCMVEGDKLLTPNRGLPDSMAPVGTRVSPEAGNLGHCSFHCARRDWKDGREMSRFSWLMRSLLLGVRIGSACCSYGSLWAKQAHRTSYTETHILKSAHWLASSHLMIEQKSPNDKISTKLFTSHCARKKQGPPTGDEPEIS